MVCDGGGDVGIDIAIHKYLAKHIFFIIMFHIMRRYVNETNSLNKTL